MSSYIHFDADHRIQVAEDLERVEGAINETGGMNVPLTKLTRLDGTSVLVHSRSIRAVSTVDDLPP